MAIAVKRASRGRTLAIHVQNPLTDPRAFDLVVAMDHDGLSGPNVISVPTALHDVTPARLGEADQILAPTAVQARPAAGRRGAGRDHQPPSAFHA